MSFFQTLRLQLAPLAAAGAAGGRPAHGPARAAARRSGGPAGAGLGQAGEGSLLAGGEVSVIDPAVDSPQVKAGKDWQFQLAAG